ncbi:hypothetical protein CERZMDRAFT_95556 [Cercospora zeae-maydis SCOH1-5]|uniref:SET domain-containing protein n=1 Tax=Cercospora zeae-maydis SCOH1-5 TaxID=717836 RepID=A0A6A6FLE0_9PEZI|nr:hypothetical protein CERZMDRAFT_95556 [Cercospora zeae-maydis SCOH1-5]
MTPAKKRRRTSSTPQAQPPPSPALPEDNKHTLFTSWAESRGVQINSVAPTHIPGRGVGLLTTTSIKKDSQIIFVPEKAMFKPLSASIKPTSSQQTVNLSPHAQLAISIMSACQDPSSTYHVWQSTWPTRADFESSMPLFWSSGLASHLPPSVQQPLERMRVDYERDLKSMLNLHLDWKEREFKYYWAIVNSRSFHFKPPGAKPGFMVLCPFIDYMNHGPSGTGVIVRQTPKGYGVIADRDYEPNTEILATYGAHPNDKLLVHYGFVNSSQPDSPSDDDVRLDHILDTHLSSNTKSQLQDVGYSGSYTLFPASSHRVQPEVCFRTQVAVRAELLTANEWEYFMLNGEDMTSDQSVKIKMWLKPLLEIYCDDASGKLAELAKLKPAEGSAEAGAVIWLKTRWKQIEQSLDTFLSLR